MCLPRGAGIFPRFFRTIPMSDEREYVTFFELTRWLLPSAVVALGLVLFFLYADSAVAVGAAVTQ